MCEFKIIKKNDNSQIMEDIVIVNYNESNELVFKDILGMAEIMKSGLILSVNTINQTLTIVDHPLINEFISLVNNLLNKKGTKEEIDKLIIQLNKLKNSL
jgi:predicted RNA-binding protein